MFLALPLLNTFPLMRERVGKVEAVIETNLKSFDIVPLIPIIEKAGGIVTTWNNKSALQGGNILATSNMKLHNKILQILKFSN